MFATVASSLLPLLLMIFVGAVAYRREILPENSATVLNGFTFYFTLPALLFQAMATTPFADIMQPAFIGGYTTAMFATYGVAFALSSMLLKSHFSESSIRATNASFCNSAYLGFPIMLFLYGDNHEVMVASTLSIILPTLLMIVCLATMELHRAGGGQSPVATIGKIALNLFKTPVIFATFAGAGFSYFGFTLPDFLSNGLRMFGMASIPCALFAVGMLIVKLKLAFSFREIVLVNVGKLVLHPIIAAFCFYAFGLRGDMLLVGIILAGLPSAAVVCVMAETYDTRVAETAAALLVGTLLYMPAMYGTLLIASMFGLHLP
ncbi:AEC family transporter [Pseudodesulfovibrio sp. zrk46]|uniref:AEC family transporter n=1 Tax=Pseudodesulfovibrio sp. zrk46 TaxID=2725288 RepID=UPI001449DA62|nr:AEC family transporter [Pseudodesulfovibrio sp. zrk46]QJB56748.1 AEC family transporter [Pseudodesulfovibrio sp. zrk46]